MINKHIYDSIISTLQQNNFISRRTGHIKKLYMTLVEYIEQSPKKIIIQYGSRDSTAKKYEMYHLKMNDGNVIITYSNEREYNSLSTFLLYFIQGYSPLYSFTFSNLVYLSDMPYYQICVSYKYD